MEHESYQYEWAKMIKPAEREIELLYKVCGMVHARHKFVLHSLIKTKQKHLTETKTLSTYHAYKEQDEKERVARKNPNKKRDRLIRQQADIEKYSQARKILIGIKSMLSPTDKRIIKKIINECFGMVFTIEFMIELDQEENNK